MRNVSVLNIRTLDFKDIGYNLKRDGWFNSFADTKNRLMSKDGAPWRGACEKHHVFFFIILAAFIDKNDVIMDWQCGVCTPSFSTSSLL